MALICVTGPVVEPVTLQEAKLHMRVDIDTDDALIAALITAAREHLETTSRPQLAMLTQTWRYLADAWPTSDVLQLRPYPLQSVSSINYTDEDGATTTMSSSDYQVDTYSQPGRIYITDGWPSTTLQDMNGLAIEFVAGYGDTASSMPQQMRQALLLLVSHWYENRETVLTSGAVPKELPFAVGALMRQWRREV